MRQATALVVRDAIVVQLRFHRPVDDDTIERIRTLNAFLQRQNSGRRRERDSAVILCGASMVRVARIGVSNGGTILFWELLDLVHLAAELIRFGYVIEGIVTRGDAAWQPGVIVGPGVASAERGFMLAGGLPRIAVDPDLLAAVESEKNLRATHHTPEEELTYIKRLLREDSDGVYFVDYLTAFEQEVDAPEFYEDLLIDHEKLTDPTMTGHTGIDRRRKLMWLTSYHERVINDRHARLRELGLTDGHFEP